ncbi:MAG: sodium-dependent transporter, partial [Sphaerochaetaceae bacterium]
FYLLPDFGKMAEAGIGEVVFAAMGQAFFTLSIGIGAMTIFGSYIDRKQSLTGESVRIIALDTFVAIMSGLIIFPACFAYGVNPGSGPSLLFITLPAIFSQMAGGRLWGGLFFLFMSFAAMTTLIAVFENIVSYWIDVHGWSRRRASAVNCAAIIVLSIPCILGFNLWSSFQPLGPGTGVLDLEDFVVSTTLLPLGSLVFLFFCCSKRAWGWKNFIAEADEGQGLKFPKWARFYITWGLPIIVLVIFAKGYWDIFSALV